MAALDSETGTSKIWDQETPRKEIELVSSSPMATEDALGSTNTTPQTQGPSASSIINPQNTVTMEGLYTQLSPRPFSPLSTPPKPLPPPEASQGGGGGVHSGSSTPNAGMGGGGPTGGGGGPGLVDANTFLGQSFGGAASPTMNQAPPSTPPAPTPPSTPAQGPASSPLTKFQTTYSMTAPTQPLLAYDPPSVSLPISVSLPSPGALPPGGGGSDPLYVLDLNTGETIPANVTLNTFSTWGENLLAQVSGATVSSYSWNVSQASDLTNVSGTTTANLQGTWASFTGSARTDTISVTETPQSGSAITMTMTFDVAATSSPAYASSRPTSSSTWPTVITPDQVAVDQETVSAGPYASMGLADGSIQTSFAMPSYNPNTTPVSLDYNSTTANAQPMFLTEYQLPTGQSVPSTITAQLTFNNTALSTVTYNTSGMNPGDIVQIALQANASSLSTNRYPWSITVTNGSGHSTYSGSVDIVNQANSPYGAGWSLDNVEQLVPLSSGVIVVEPGGSSLWFANNGSGGFITPAGDFSTLTLSGGVYTQTLTDGTKLSFNSSGQETSSVDCHGNTTSFAYNSSGLLTSITDMNNQVTTLAYNSSNLLTSITDPASRSATLAYSGKQLTSITDPANDLWKYSYDSANDLTGLTDPNNHTTTFTYNSAERVSSVTQPDSTTLQLTPVQMNGYGAAGGNVTAVLLAVGDAAQYTDANSKVWTTGLDWLGFGLPVLRSDPLGDTLLIYRDGNGLPWMSSDELARRTREFFSSQGNATEVVQADDSYAKYYYGAFSEVTEYVDPTNFATTYAYDSKGNLTQQTDALSHSTTYAYNSAGMVTSTTDPLNNVTTFSYNSLNELTSTTNALNQTTTLAYTSAGLVSSSTDALGYVTTFAYDALNELTGETVPDSSITNSVYSYSYDKVGNKTSETDPLNHTTTYNYNAVNEMTSVTNALNQTTTYNYDAAGNLTDVTNPLSQTTTLSYNAAGELTGVTNALSKTTTIAYDAAGEKTSETNPLSQTTTYSYTVLGKLSSTTDPAGDVTSYTYNSTGDLTSLSLSGNSQSAETTTFGYNQVHERTSVTDPLSYASTYSYDANGNLSTATDQLQHQTTYGYNALNELTAVTDPMGNQTTFGYDANGDQTSVTNPLGKTTSYTYDAQGRVLTETAPNSGVTTYAYDLAGNLTSLTDPDNNTTSYSYDAANELTATTNPLSYQTTYSYNSAGELTSTTDADGRTITYGYDAAGQRTSETWVNGSYTATYQYNAAGELTSASDPYSTYTYTYDSAGRVTSVDNAGTSGVPTVTLSYGYDTYGNRTSLTDSLGGSISYTFDARNELTGLTLSLNSTTKASVTMSYNRDGFLSNETRSSPSGSSIGLSLTYDNGNRLTAMDYSIGTTMTLENYLYGYNAGSQLTSYQDSSSNSLTYSYDSNGELTGASGTLNGSSYSVTYGYDANGNRNMTGYSTGTGNELLNDGTYSYTYDHDGNMATQTNLSTHSVTYYSWDYRNRLTEVKEETSGGTVINDEKFTYDVNDNRIGVSLNGTQQLYTVYDGDNSYIDFNGSGTLTERYLTNPRGLNEFYGQVNAGGTPQWFLTDNVHSIHQVVSSSGTSLDTITYDPFGNMLNQTNSSNAPRFLFTGGAYDSITGDYVDGAREDNPSDGRWLSADPLGFAAGDSNLYRYVGNNPLQMSDPAGLEATTQEEGRQPPRNPSPSGLGYQNPPPSQQYDEVWWMQKTYEMMRKEQIEREQSKTHTLRQLDAMRRLYTDWNMKLQERIKNYDYGIEQDKKNNRIPPSREAIKRLQQQIEYNQKILDAILWHINAINIYITSGMQLEQKGKVTVSIDRLKDMYKYDYEQLNTTYKQWMRMGPGSPTYLPPAGQPPWWRIHPVPINPTDYNPIWWESHP